MDALYSKLYATYNEFKTNKFTEMEKLNRNQEEKFLAFTNAADELLQQYRIENDRLLAENEDLRSELALTRLSMDDKIAEYQKLLMEENQKKKELLQETERLQSLQREGLCCISRYEKNEKPSSPDRSQVGLDLVKKLAAKKRKFSTSEACTETIDTECGDGELGQSVLEDSSDQLSKRSRFSENLLGSDQPKCFKQKTSLSGYSFSLTWIKNSQGDDELLYRVLSLGTIESIAPEWMKEILMFNTNMCPVFFERMSRVVELF